MGYMCRQWLNRGRRIRMKSYGVIPVKVSCYQYGTGWLMERGIKLRLVAEKANGEYQALFLSDAEVNAALMYFIQYASSEMKERVLLTLMRKLSHAKLLRALALELRKRVRLPRQS